MQRRRLAARAEHGHARRVHHAAAEAFAPPLSASTQRRVSPLLNLASGLPSSVREVMLHMLSFGDLEPLELLNVEYRRFILGFIRHRLHDLNIDGVARPRTGNRWLLRAITLASSLRRLALNLAWWQPTLHGDAELELLQSLLRRNGGTLRVLEVFHWRSRAYGSTDAKFHELPLPLQDMRFLLCCTRLTDLSLPDPMAMFERERLDHPPRIVASGTGFSVNHLHILRSNSGLSNLTLHVAYTPTAFASPLLDPMVVENGSLRRLCLRPYGHNSGWPWVDLLLVAPPRIWAQLTDFSAEGVHSESLRLLLRLDRLRALAIDNMHGGPWMMPVLTKLHLRGLNHTALRQLHAPMLQDFYVYGMDTTVAVHDVLVRLPSITDCRLGWTCGVGKLPSSPPSWTPPGAQSLTTLTLESRREPLTDTELACITASTNLRTLTLRHLGGEQWPPHGHIPCATVHSLLRHLSLLTKFIIFTSDCEREWSSLPTCPPTRLEPLVHRNLRRLLLANHDAVLNVLDAPELQELTLCSGTYRHGLGSFLDRPGANLELSVIRGTIDGAAALPSKPTSRVALICSMASRTVQWDRAILPRLPALTCLDLEHRHTKSEPRCLADVIGDLEALLVAPGGPLQRLHVTWTYHSADDEALRLSAANLFHGVLLGYPSLRVLHVHKVSKIDELLLVNIAERCGFHGRLNGQGRVSWSWLFHRL